MFADSVFKAYDIRGIYPEQLHADFAYALGRVLGQQAHQHQISQIVIGHDNRLSSPILAQALEKGILDSGTNTLMLGEVPTPLVYFVSYHHAIGACVAITGSHNPTEYNGFKIMMGGRTLHGAEIKALAQEMQKLAHAAPSSPIGQSKTYSPISDYIQYIVGHIQIKRPMKIAIDCGNAVCSLVAPTLYRSLGIEIDPLFCESDGRFPNHHPDPADPHNLQDLIKHVQNSDCELGLAFDGDGDRLGVVTKSGEIIWPDRQLILFAKDVLSRQKNARIIYDVKCSRHVGLAIEEAGGEAIMSATGHSLIKAKLNETQAALAGEMSGHIFFKERWFGFDDGLYAGARMLEILSAYTQASEVLEQLPKDISTPEIKIELTQEGLAHQIIQKLQAYTGFQSSDISRIDGVRVHYPQGFGLARASNTTPVIVLRFEAETTEALTQIQADFKKAFTQIAPEINYPF